MHDSRYWIWLSLAFQPGNTGFDKLFRAFGYNAKAIYEADSDAYAKIFGNRSDAIRTLCDKRIDNALKILDFCEKNNIGLLTPDENKYPSSLLRIQGQPPVIYYKGTVPDFSANLSIAVVGTRNVTSYGTSAAYTISHDLAYAGAIIVSGMAIGTDTAAHRGALDAKGTTVAFLGSGINVIYPKDNSRLFDEITESGAVMTDYPPFSRPEGRHFPIRNRLISGVSHGVLVIEAAKKSGALLTANHAINQGKLLYALPGRIGELTSEGTNNLLLSGAKAVTKTEDIISDFDHLFRFRPIPNRSGYTQFSSGIQSADNKAFNPFGGNGKGIGAYSGNGSFYDRFTPMPESRPDNKSTDLKPNGKARKISRVNPAPRYFDPQAYRNQAENRLSEPKPLIIYSDFDDSEFKKANESLTDQQKEELESIGMLSHRTVIKYPEAPVPEGGYKVKLTKEKIEEFDRLTDDMNKRAIAMDEIRSGIKVRSPFKGVNDLKELDRLYMEDRKKQESRSAEKEKAGNETEIDYTGLSGVEISVLKLLENGDKLTVDSMSCLGIPLPKLLSLLTVLEIKKRIVQLPGGFFQINKKL